MKLALVLLLSCPLFAQNRNLADYERYLVPILTAQPLPGAYGSLWTTSLWLRNDGPEPVDVFPLEPHCITSSVCFFTMPGVRSLHAGRALWHAMPQYQALRPAGRLAGGFVYVERERARQVSLRLSVSDISRTPPGSTQIPVVPEREFFDTARSILGVKLVTGSRVSLRIYTGDERPEASVIVRVHELVATQIAAASPPYTPRLVAERTLTFAHDPAADACAFIYGCPAGARYIPATIQIGNLLDAFPELATARAADLFGVRIEIEPAIPGLRYWPLVTETRDRDGFVSVYTVH